MIGMEAVYSVLNLHLAGLCGGRVFPDLAPSATSRPYVVYFHATGGNVQVRRGRKSERHTFLVKIVADTAAESFALEPIETLLHNNGTQGLNTLPVNAEWEITTVTQGAALHAVELVNGQPLYSTGYEYEFVLEQRP